MGVSVDLSPQGAEENEVRVLEATQYHSVQLDQVGMAGCKHPELKYQVRESEVQEPAGSCHPQLQGEPEGQIFCEAILSQGQEVSSRLRLHQLRGLHFW